MTDERWAFVADLLVLTVLALGLWVMLSVAPDADRAVLNLTGRTAEESPR